MKINTSIQMFFNACEKYDKPNAVMVKKDGQYRPVSHKFFKQRVSQFARGLMSLGVQPKEHVAILGETRFEWAIADLAIVGAGGVSVPIYPSISSEQVAYILHDSESIGVVCSTEEQAKKVMAIQGIKDKLKFIIIMDDMTTAPAGTLLMKDVETQGVQTDNEADFIARWKGVQSSDLLTLIYTSGTTGNPKGVMLSHKNVMSNVESCAELMPCSTDDTCLSHLPLSHILERMGGFFVMIHHGVTIAYAESINKVAENLLEVRPTMMVSVPRLFEKIYTKIMTNAEAGSFLKKTIFNWAMSTAKKSLPYLLNDKEIPGFLATKYGIADKLVFSKIKEKTGGRLQWVISGGAPLPKEIADLFNGIGIKMVEGYGLTETSPVLCINPLDKIKPGTVGPAVKDVVIKIAEDGEILAQGPNIMLGYYNNPEATAETIKDGWFHTGDIGMMDEDGFLAITDRKKEILVTSGGKNVAPQPIENSLKLSNYIEQAVILGDNRKFISALIVPPWETVNEWASSKGWPTDPVALSKHEGFNKFMASEIDFQLREFAHYEKVKKFVIVPRLLTEEEGELTPSLKLKRKNITQNFYDEIEDIYNV